MRSAGSSIRRPDDRALAWPALGRLSSGKARQPRRSGEPLHRLCRSARRRARCWISKGSIRKNTCRSKTLQIFAGHVKARTGRYPVLYTNHATAKHIAANRFKHRLLARLPLWYARYKPDIRKVFPMGNWDRYALWQFSSAHNCGKKRCPYRVPGTLDDIDVNVASDECIGMKESGPTARFFRRSRRRSPLSPRPPSVRSRR